MPGALSLLISRCCFLKWLFKSKLWENRDYESKKKAHNSSSLKDKVLKRLQGLERPRAWWRSIKWVLGWCWLPRATITDPQNLRRLPTTDTYCSLLFTVGKMIGSSSALPYSFSFLVVRNVEIHALPIPPSTSAPGVLIFSKSLLKV